MELPFDVIDIIIQNANVKTQIQLFSTCRRLWTKYKSTIIRQKIKYYDEERLKRIEKKKKRKETYVEHCLLFLMKQEKEYIFSHMFVYNSHAKVVTHELYKYEREFDDVIFKAHKVRYKNVCWHGIPRLYDVNDKKYLACKIKNDRVTGIKYDDLISTFKLWYQECICVTHYPFC